MEPENLILNDIANWDETCRVSWFIHLTSKEDLTQTRNSA